MTEVTGSKGEPWQVTMSRTGDGYVVHLIIGGVMVILPALEAHKLGSALRIASGIDTSDESSAGDVCVSQGAPAERGAGAANPGAPSIHDIEQHAGYFCATHGFVLIDFCSCPDDDIVSLWTNERDDEQFVRVLNRYRESSGAPIRPDQPPVTATDVNRLTLRYAAEKWGDETSAGDEDSVTPEELGYPDWYGDLSPEDAAAGIASVTMAVWQRINEHADQLTGTDFNVIRGWLDCTIRPALFGDESSAGATNEVQVRDTDGDNDPLWFATAGEAFEYARAHPFAWKISWDDPHERVRLIKVDTDLWRYAPLMEEIADADRP